MSNSIKIYLRKIFDHDLDHQINITQGVTSDFFGVSANEETRFIKGKTSQQEGEVKFLFATDVRLGGAINKIISGEGKLEIGDILMFSKQKGNCPYILELVKKTDERYKVFNSVMTEVRHLTLSIDDESLLFDKKSIDIVRKPEVTDDYTTEDFFKDVFITEQHYKLLVQLMLYKKNVIIKGAPGVGKTFLAKRLAYAIKGTRDAQYIESIQFHQSYSYEDFIMGYKPNDIGFELRNGIFYNFCKKAEQDLEHKYFFIIDEINRGNLSKIFGELMVLIEADKRGENIKLAYKQEESFSIPPNVYLLGMMNTSDRGLASIDYALRRRFSFFEIEPAFDNPKFKEYLKTFISDTTFLDELIDKFTKLNNFIADTTKSGLGKGFCIGHSYFCIPPIRQQKISEWYNNILKFEIFPLLEEYWWDDTAKYDEWKAELHKIQL